jgi:hypothetical protein
MQNNKNSFLIQVSCLYSGHKLQLATEVKYLGLTLDKGLTWKTQLGNVINKAYRP